MLLSRLPWLISLVIRFYLTTQFLTQNINVLNAYVYFYGNLWYFPLIYLHNYIHKVFLLYVFFCASSELLEMGTVWDRNRTAMVYPLKNKVL